MVVTQSGQLYIQSQQSMTSVLAFKSILRSVMPRKVGNWSDFNCITALSTPRTSCWGSQRIIASPADDLVVRHYIELALVKEWFAICLIIQSQCRKANRFQKDFWTDAVTSVPFFINWIAFATLRINSTPYELCRCSKPVVDQFRMFGSHCWYHAVQPIDPKLDQRARTNILLT